MVKLSKHVYLEKVVIEKIDSLAILEQTQASKIVEAAVNTFYDIWMEKNRRIK